YRNEKATAEVMRGEWLLTGDMAKQDEEGFIYLVDRKKDVIVCGGENLYPVEIENFMRKFDKIKDVAVIGLPDKRLGEIPAAIVEIKSGEKCTQEEVDEFCLALPRYKRPKRVIFAKVPRNATGKIEKPLLRKTYNADNIVDEQNRS
ncbi:MAG: AMP-binding protein, partial [Clostridia bacterium]|nr:AMP-binding protein [Clostridia bacterium]